MKPDFVKHIDTGFVENVSGNFDKYIQQRERSKRIVKQQQHVETLESQVKNLTELVYRLIEKNGNTDNSS